MKLHLNRLKSTVTGLAGAALFALAGTAQAQGTVNVICSTDQAWCDLAASEFQKQTGVKVQQTRRATGEALAQLRAEASNPKTDLWWGGTGDPFFQAAEVGLLEPYRPAYINDLHSWSVRQYAMTQNMVGGFYTSAIGLGWNTEVLRKKNLPEPKCWADMIKPEYKGDVDISHPASSGTAYTILAGLVQMMGEEQAFDYMKKLHKNVSSYTRSGTAQAPNVAKGEVAVGISFIFGFDGWRLNKLVAQDVDKSGIVRILDPLLAAYATQRRDGERFGTFVVRTGVVASTSAGNQFHADVRLLPP